MSKEDIAEAAAILELVEHLSNKPGVFDAVVPLQTLDGPPGEIIGSGSLLRIADDHFLITASHVVSEFGDEGFRIPVFSGSHVIAPTATGIRAVDDRTHDVAALKLDADAVLQLKKRFRFMTMADVEPVPPGLLSAGYCVVIGYPQQLATEDENGVTLVPYLTACKVAPPDTREELPRTAAYDPAHHILLRRRARVFNLVGDEQSPVHPRGQSGGPLFYVGQEDDTGAVERRAEHVRWIGVQSRAYGASVPGTAYLSAVAFESVARLIVQRWPDLSPAFALHRYGKVPRRPWPG